MIYHDEPDFTLHVGDALETLRTLPNASVNCCVTSPPYWGLRDYGVDGQLGLEATPGLYVAAMVDVFREVRRVLADDGTCWVNLGDSYGSGTTAARNPTSIEGPDVPASWSNRSQPQRNGLKPKDLVGIPWRVAFALQADGWYLRSDIVWAKPNPMPESVTDRPTKAHEYVFLLSKSPRYFYDAGALREDAGWERWGGQTSKKYNGDGSGSKAEMVQRRSKGEIADRFDTSTRNGRSVWAIATESYPDAHFATFPQALARRCILAGCPEWVCGTCEKARERIVERESAPLEVFTRRTSPDDGFVTGKGLGGEMRGVGQKLQAWRDEHPIQTVGWSDCGHSNYRQGVVLDPFMGSGTVALVAKQERRRAVGIELNPEYANLAVERCRIWWRKRDPVPNIPDDQLSLLGSDPE